MTARRRRASRWLAAFWLFGQLAMALFTVAALDAVPVRTIRSGHCDCPGSPETATCPMHGRAGLAHHNGTPCAMRQCATPHATVITVASGFVVSPLPSLHDAGLDPSPLFATRPRVRDHAIRPEAPPPRA